MDPDLVSYTKAYRFSPSDPIHLVRYNTHYHAQHRAGCGYCLGILVYQNRDHFIHGVTTGSKLEFYLLCAQTLFILYCQLPMTGLDKSQGARQPILLSGCFLLRSMKVLLAGVILAHNHLLWTTVIVHRIIKCESF